MSEVSIDTGPLKGVMIQSKDGSGVAFFGGIPYAAPPVGELRWQAPQAPDCWTELRDATTYGASCPQFVHGEGGFRDSITRGLGIDPPEAEALTYDEDCLFLNVFSSQANCSLCS